MQIVYTRKGKPAIWIGGGAGTSTTKALFVISRGHLPLPFVVKQRGPLACSQHQALVPLHQGDYVVRISMFLDMLEALTHEDLPAPSGLTVARFNGTSLEPCDPDPVLEWFSHGPKDEVTRVLTGLRRYHNRDGALFCKEGTR